MAKISTLVLVLAMLAVAPARAEHTHTRVLLPIYVGIPLPGAHGAQFMTTLTAYNANDTPAEISQAPSFLCQIGGCAPTFWPAHSVATPFGGGERGAFMNIDAADDKLVKFQLRAQDITRQSLTAGTELPVVRKGDYSGERVDLLNVPIDTRFRQMTRIYDYNAEPVRVIVRVYPMDIGRGDELLGERELDLRPASTGVIPRIDDIVMIPSYGQLGDITTEFPGAAGESRVRLEIRPAVPGTLIWAFTSITHNETQHITLVTPN